jgi:DNA-directed RNA polymerase subunit RPC12/RpoP
MLNKKIFISSIMSDVFSRNMLKNPELEEISQKDYGKTYNKLSPNERMGVELKLSLPKRKEVVRAKCLTCGGNETKNVGTKKEDYFQCEECGERRQNKFLIRNDT